MTCFLLVTSLVLQFEYPFQLVLIEHLFQLLPIQMNLLLLAKAEHFPIQDRFPPQGSVRPRIPDPSNSGLMSNMPTRLASSGTGFPSHPLETLLFLALTRLLLQSLMLLSWLSIPIRLMC